MKVSEMFALLKISLPGSMRTIKYGQRNCCLVCNKLTDIY